MYKIMLLVRDGKQPLWTPYCIEQSLEIPEEPVTQSEGTLSIEYCTDNLDELEQTVIELLKIYTTSQIKVIQDVTYTLDLLIV